ncbi:MAG: cell division protein SepF [Acidimicrobiales bacterium]
MSTVWRKAMIALGLGDDDEYDDFEPEPRGQTSAPQRQAQQVAPHQPVTPAAVQPRSVQPVANRTASVSPLPGVPATDAAGGGQMRFPTSGGPPDQPTVRPVAAPASRDDATGGGGGHEPSSPSTSGVRTIARPSAKPHVVAPRSFHDAPEVADRFKSKQPVIMNLQGVERDLSRRLVDFASGMCYGLGGQMEKVATDVFLLTPTDVEVSAEERQRLQERGLYDH